MVRLIERIWRGEASFLGRLLELPLAVAELGYRAGLRWDQRRKLARRETLPRPVISVGNLTVGGSGKTPLVQWISQWAEREGLVPCVLSRGYGVSIQSPARVTEGPGDWRFFGDEPTLLAQGLRSGCVYVGRDRAQAGRLALEREPRIDFFILDDGFQHLALARDLDLVLVDAAIGLGNGRLLPRGPLREPPAALDRADAIGLARRAGWSVSSLGPHLPTPDFEIDLEPTAWRPLADEDWLPLETLPRDRPARLLSGIASPSGFEATARAVGLRVHSHSIFRDHHAFTREEAESERRLAREQGLRLVTTAKDGVRLAEFTTGWTAEEVPIMIELGLKDGVGLEYLKETLKLTWSRADIAPVSRG